MIVSLDVDLDEGELAELAKLANTNFMAASEIAEKLSEVIHRELQPGVDVGWLYRATYYREEEGERHGYRMYQHTFMGPYWPHVEGRPRLYWDGAQLRSRGGAFSVDASRGIIDCDNASRTR